MESSVGKFFLIAVLSTCQRKVKIYMRVRDAHTHVHTHTYTHVHTHTYTHVHTHTHAHTHTHTHAHTHTHTHKTISDAPMLVVQRWKKKCIDFGPSNCALSRFCRAHALPLSP